MSAFLCEDNLFKELACYYANKKHQYDSITVKDETLIESAEYFANLLLITNVASLNCRYEDGASMFGYVEGEKLSISLDYFKEHLVRDLSAVQRLKLCDCLEYQSCEHDDYRDGAGYRLLNDIRGLLINDLAGYDAASWGMPEDIYNEEPDH